MEDDRYMESLKCLHQESLHILGFRVIHLCTILCSILKDNDNRHVPT